MNEALNRFIGEHSVCPDRQPPLMIFRTEAEQKELLRLVYASGGRVGFVVWYEYCRVGEQKIGMGGYADPFSEGFMWAETQIPCADLDKTPLDGLLAYMEAVRQEYTGYQLVPEFYIKGYETL